MKISNSLEERKELTVTPDQAKSAAVFFLNNNPDLKAKGLPRITEDNIENIQTIENENNLPIIYAII